MTTTTATQTPKPASDFQRLVPLAAWAGIAGAIMFLVGDLIGPHPATLGGVGLLEVPQWSLQVAAWLGILAVPLLMFNCLAIYRGLRAAGWRWSVVPLLVYAFGLLLSISRYIGYLYFRFIVQVYFN